MADNKVFIGTIAYGALTAPYLPLFKESLAKQTFKDFSLIIHDNTNNNLGFSRAYNLMIDEARQKGATYFFVVNPDIYLEPSVLEKLVAALDKDLSLTAVAPKLKQWDFKNNNFTNIIDSCGLGLKNCLHFFDYGQGEVDRGQYDEQLISGPGGAAGLWRISDLLKLRENGQYFDEHFFMYKEDCDLIYRAQLAGCRSILVPEAIGYHDRTSAAGSLLKRFLNRFKRSRQVNRWAFTNQHFLFIKYWRRQSFFSKLLGLGRIKVMFFEALLLEQYLLPCYKTIFKQAKTLKRY